MNERIHTLKTIEDCDNLTGRQKYIIQSTVEHLEHLEKQRCENCKHFSEGKQPNGFLWNDCDYSFNCSVIRPNNFKEKVIQ